MQSVSGIITTYGRKSDIVEQAVQSMLNQTYKLLEVLVIDDNQNDSPLCDELTSMCSKYKGVRYIKQDGNKGACAARNMGINNANGEYVAFLDDDDYWLPTKIEKQLHAFERADSKVGMVYCCGLLKNVANQEEGDYYSFKTFREKIKYEDMLEFDYIGSTSNPLIRKNCFDKVGGFWEEQPARQDYEMWIRISNKFEIIGIHERLFAHMIHPGDQISKSNSRAHRGYINIYQRYKDDYNTNLKARYSILSEIFDTRNRDSVKLEDVYYYLLKKITELRIK